MSFQKKTTPEKIMQPQDRKENQRMSEVAKKVYQTNDIREASYKKYQKRIDESVEAAFTNIQWSNFESEPRDKQVTAMKSKHGVTLMWILNLVQYPRFVRQDEVATHLFLWEVKAYIITSKHTLMKRKYWHRLQKLELELFAKGMLYAVNTKPCSWAMDGDICKFIVSSTDADLPVITVALEEINEKAKLIQEGQKNGQSTTTKT